MRGTDCFGSAQSANFPRELVVFGNARGQSPRTALELLVRGAVRPTWVSTICPTCHSQRRGSSRSIVRWEKSRLRHTRAVDYEQRSALAEALELRSEPRHVGGVDDGLLAVGGCAKVAKRAAPAWGTCGMR